jgi:hypothetical protein
VIVDSFTALAVLVVALLPGGLFTWAYEQEIGASGQALADRLLRLVGVSAMLHALAAPLTWWFYVRQIRTGRLLEAPLSWPVWLALLAYVLVPVGLGRLIGVIAWRRPGWVRGLAGPAPAPRAWDHVFSGGHGAWMRIRLKDPAGGTNGWLAGAYAQAERGPAGYAAGFPHEQDIYLTDTAEVDDRGRLLRDPDGSIRRRGWGLLVSWSEIAYMEIFWTEGG